MKRQFILGGGVIAIAAALTGGARAETLTAGAGVPVVIPTDNTLVTITFQESFAGYKGRLYYLGWGDTDTITHHATDSGPPGLGKLLFKNHMATPGATRTLTRRFDGGEVLHFAYDIVKPNWLATELFRTDDADDDNYFAWNTNQNGGVFSVEDVRGPHPASDFDYNDIVVTLQFDSTPLPAPAGLALLAAAGLGARRRRRRER